jgi:hypothetical protein
MHRLILFFHQRQFSSAKRTLQTLTDPFYEMLIARSRSRMPIEYPRVVLQKYFNMESPAGCDQLGG